VSSNSKVVVTGIAGLIGGILRRFLRDRWELYGVDLNPTPNFPSSVDDINNQESMANIFKGAYAVVHLAGNPNRKANWEEIIHANIAGTKSVFEAAKKAGVRKVIFASSNQVTGLYERDEPYRSIVEGKHENLNEEIPLITHKSPICPNGPYGISKAFGEALGRYYSDAFGMEVLCLRIGTVNRHDRPSSARQYATLLSHRDLASLIDTCLKARKNVSFDIFYGVSANPLRFWDIKHPNEVLGWFPLDHTRGFRNEVPHAR